MDLHSKVIIGTWPLSGDFGPASPATSESLLRACLDHRFRTFDTAPNYGHGFAELLLGMVLGGERDIAVYTKFGNRPHLGKDFSAPSLTASLEQSLVRLRRDAVEGVFLHNPRNEIGDYAGLLSNLQALKAQGLTGSIGLSGARGADYSAVPFDRLDMYQQDVNILYQDEIAEGATSGPSLFARSVLATGMLSGRLTADTVFPDDDHRGGWLKGDRLRSLVARIETVRSILPPDVSVPMGAMRFVLGQPSVDRVILGARSPAHVEMLAEAVAAGPLDDHTEQALRAAYADDFGRPSRERDLGY